MEDCEIDGRSEDTNTGYRVTAILRTQQTRCFTSNFYERFFFSFVAGPSLHLAECNNLFPGMITAAIGSLKVAGNVGFPRRVRAIQGFGCRFGVPFTTCGRTTKCESNNEGRTHKHDIPYALCTAARTLFRNFASLFSRSESLLWPTTGYCAHFPFVVPL